MTQVEIHRFTFLPPQLPALEKKAVGEGFKFLTRLLADWRSGANRFDAPGECLMAAYANQELIGMEAFQWIHMERLIRQDCDGCPSSLLPGGNTWDKR